MTVSVFGGQLIVRDADEQLKEVSIATTATLLATHPAVLEIYRQKIISVFIERLHNPVRTLMAFLHVCGVPLVAIVGILFIDVSCVCGLR